LDKWAYDNGVTMDFSRPGKPMDNAMIESFNGSFRDECLNIEFRPHGSLGDLTPRQFVDKFLSRINGQKTPLLAGPVFGRGSWEKWAMWMVPLLVLWILFAALTLIPPVLMKWGPA
jgi:hypothetical protein